MKKKIVCTAVLLALAVVFSPMGAAAHPWMDTKNQVMLIDGSWAEGNVCNSSGFQNRDFFRVMPDGTVGDVPFEIPKNHHLVITDVEWTAYGTVVPLAAGNSLRFKIFLGPSSNGAQVYSSGVDLTVDSVTGRPGKSDHLSVGFVVAPGVAMCPYANQERPNYGAVGYVDSIILRGYLTR